jgi:hypothetical protein
MCYVRLVSAAQHNWHLFWIGPCVAFFGICTLKLHFNPVGTMAEAVEAATARHGDGWKSADAGCAAK